MKKFISLLAAGVLGFAALPLSASAIEDDPDKCYGIPIPSDVSDRDPELIVAINEKYADEKAYYGVLYDYGAYGDVNDDGSVDAIDACLVLDYYARAMTNGYEDPEEREYFLERADIYADKCIDAGDASHILSIYSYYMNVPKDDVSAETNEILTDLGWL